jgi:hypothetical protein
MRNKTCIILTTLSCLLFIGCASTGHLYTREGTGLNCLGTIAVKPYGLDVREFLVPQEIEKKIGKPLSIEKIPVLAGDYEGLKIIYKYPNATFYFMQNNFATALYSVEIFKGSIGCLKIGTSKKEYESKFGSINGQNYDQKTFFIKRDSKDPVEIKFGLYVEFKNDLLSLVRPDFGEIFKTQED